MVSVVTSAAEQAAHLTRQMLAYAGKGRFFVECIDLPKLVNSTCGLIGASIPNSVRLTIEPGPPDCLIEADCGQIQQIVMNLIINAAEAVGPDRVGTVWVRTGAVDVDQDRLQEGVIVSESHQSGPHVFVEVEDTGVGTDDATLSRIFDPFFTTKFTGRGLGLAASLKSAASLAREQRSEFCFHSLIWHALIWHAITTYRFFGSKQRTRSKMARCSLLMTSRSSGKRRGLRERVLADAMALLHHSAGLYLCGAGIAPCNQGFAARL